MFTEDNIDKSKFEPVPSGKVAVEELSSYIALTMARGVGPVLARRLISTLGSAKNVIETPQRKLEMVPGVGSVLAEAIKQPNLLDCANRELDFLAKVGGKAICDVEADYPKRLKECEDCPIVLYQKGNMHLEEKHVLGVVGTRKMTAYGRTHINNVLKELSERVPDLLIVSGLAHGVDGAAHRCALELGVQTVGVVGHGLNMIYPAEHRGLSERMMANGGMLTEFHSHSSVDRKNFVSRNRIIAGLCDVIWVVESGEKGGALLTADFADSYSREVCALPGRVGDLYSIGCNNLIKKNRAVMVENADDIIQMMNWDQKAHKKEAVQLSLFMDLTERERLVVQVLEIEGRMQVNQMVRKLQLPMNELSSLLFDLEMKDVVCSFPGGVYGLK